MTRSKVLSILLLVLLTAGTTRPSTTTLPDSSRFYFPHFTSGQGNETTFVISNSSALDADVRFTGYGDQGDLLALRPAPATVTITAQSEARIRASDLLDISTTGTVSGWVKAESANPQLTAWMQISLGNMAGDKVDALPVSDQTAQKIVFSAVFGTGETITGIGLANPDSHVAHVKASLYSAGSLVEVQQFQLQGYGHRASLLNELFRNTVAAGHVEIDSDVALVGLQTFSQVDRWSAVPMQLFQNNSEFVFPIPALPGRFSTKIALVNSEEHDLNLNLTAFSNGTSPSGSVNRSLPPHGELIASLSDLFGDSMPAIGFVSVKSDLGPASIFGAKPALSGLVVLREDAFPGLASFSLPPAQNRESIFSPVNAQSAVSLINGQDGGSKIRLSMIGKNGSIVGENEIAQNGRSSFYGGPGDLTKATDAGNLVLMGADQPLTSLQIESTDNGFYAIPGQIFKSRAVYSSGQLLSHVSGGTVLSKDEAFSVSVPLNALKQDVAIQLNGLSADAVPPVNAGRRLVGASDFEPAGLEFLFPATIKMLLLKKQTPGSSVPLELVNASNRYQPAGPIATIGSDGASASASISRFSMFALTSEKPVVRVTPAKPSIEVGGTVQLTAAVTGNGIQDVDWFVEGVPGGNSNSGRIRSDGLYTAPRTVPPFGWVSVKAVSVDDPTATFEAQVTIVNRVTDGPGGTAGTNTPAAVDAVVLSGPVDPACSGCHAYQ